MKGIFTTIKVAAFVLMSLSLVNCGGGGGGTNSSPISCSANQLSTSVGCLPQCGSGMVWYNNQCLAAGSVTAAGAVQSCGTGMLQSQYGCLPQCGPTSVMYQNQCVPATTAIGGIGGIGGVGGIGGIGGIGGVTASNMCSGRCGQGAVETYSGCLPQYTCGACYGYSNGWCVIGVNARAYYGF